MRWPYDSVDATSWKPPGKRSPRGAQPPVRQLVKGPEFILDAPIQLERIQTLLLDPQARPHPHLEYQLHRGYRSVPNPSACGTCVQFFLLDIGGPSPRRMNRGGVAPDRAAVHSAAAGRACDGSGCSHKTRPTSSLRGPVAPPITRVNRPEVFPMLCRPIVTLLETPCV